MRNRLKWLLLSISKESHYDFTRFPSPWVPANCEAYTQQLAAITSRQTQTDIGSAIQAAIDENRTIHESNCINLNPATNAMNPKAEAALASGLGSRPSLGYPGDKYEMGLEGVQKIEVIAAELAAEVFGAPLFRNSCSLRSHCQPLCLHGGSQGGRLHNCAPRLRLVVISRTT